MSDPGMFTEEELKKAQGRQLLARALQMYGQQPDVSALNEYAAQRQRQGRSDMMTALAAQFAGKSFEPVQETFLKRSLAARSPQEIGDYGFVANGKFTANPYASRKEQIAGMQNFGNKVMEREQADMLEEGRNNRNAEDNKARMAEARVRANGMGGAAGGAAGGIYGNATNSGYTPTGTRVVTDRKGNMYQIGQQNGKTTYEPYEGDVIPTASWNKQIDEVQPLIASSRSIGKLIQTVEAQPEAFSRALGFTSELPTTFGIRQAAQEAAAGDPEILKTRSVFARNAAKELHEMYGAAQTLNEEKRAKSFLYDENDTPEILLGKLKAAKEWADDYSTRKGGGVMNTARTRLDAGSQRTVVRRGTRRDGTPVVQYSDGSIE